MKAYFKFFMSMAAAVIALSSCQKEIESKDAPAKEKGVLSITVKATQEALKSEAGTKTYIDGTSVFWGTGEYMKIGVFDGEGTAWGTSNDESADVWSGTQEALFTFSIAPKTESGTYTYYGMYPASAAATSSNNDPATYKVNLPAAQNATASSYDPKAYILVAQPDGGHDAVMTDWDAAFRRATALNKITLKNLPEDIKRVSITAPENVKLAGGRHINLTTGQSDDIYSGVNKIDVKFDAPQATGSDVVVWFTSWDAEIPVDANLTIVAYSTAHTFTRTLTVANKSITFKEGCLNTLNVNMSSADQGDNTELEPGDYVVLAKNNTTYYAMKAEVTGTGTSTRMVSVDYTGNLDSYNGDGDIVWTIENTGSAYTIKNGSNYLGWTSGNYAAFVAEESYSDEVCLMDITYNEGTYLISSNSDSERKLARNTSNAYFAFYAGTQYKDIVFVPATVDTRSDVTLAFEDAVVNLTTSDYDQFFGQEDVTATPDVEAVLSHLSWSYTDPDGIIDNFDNGSLELNGKTGTATVTVSFAGDENYRPAEASYTITITDGSTPATDYSTLETSNVTLTPGTNGSVVNVDGDATAIKVGTSSKGGDMSVTVPSGTTKLHIHAAAWKGVSGLSLNISGATVDPESIALTADDGISNSTPFTLNGKPEDFYFAIELSGITAETVITFTSSIAKRFVVWGVNAEQVVDNRQDAEMSWSAEAATATFNTGNTISFTAPTLDQGNASAVTYESTDATIATIDENTGEVTIAALNENVVTEGSTTIKAVFAGDDNYKPQTVSYTLTVADGRAQVPTPSFDTPEGEVTAGTDVAFECELDEVNFHYTVNGTTPTVDSPIGTSVVIDEPTTVKIIAEKLGYKLSEVASATYTISGVQPHDGSLEYPYTVAEALDIISGYTDKQKSATVVYVSGIIANVGSYNSTYHSVTYDISDNGENTNTLTIYSGKFVANTNFSSSDQLTVGDEVLVYGYLYLYGTTKEMYQNNYIYSLNGISKALTAGSLTATPDNDNKQITVTWGAATGTDSAISYLVTCGDQNFNASAAGSHTFTMADYGSYDISVVASATDAFSVTTSTTATLTDPGSGETNISVTVATYASANSWSTGTKYTSIPIDGNVTASVVGSGANSGKYYTSNPAGWRFYQTEASNTSLSISAANNHTIKSVTITYANKNGGTLVHSSSHVSSGTSVTVNAASVSFTVGNTGTVTNGQIAVSAITVVYE